MFSLQMSAVCGIQGYPAELQASPPCQGLDVQGGQVPKIARSLVGWASQLTAAGLDGLTIIAVPPALDRFPQYNRHFSRGREGPCCCERGARRTWWQAEAAYESREEAWRHLQGSSRLPEVFSVGWQDFLEKEPLAEPSEPVQGEEHLEDLHEAVLFEMFPEEPKAVEEALLRFAGSSHQASRALEALLARPDSKTAEDEDDLDYDCADAGVAEVDEDEWEEDWEDEEYGEYWEDRAAAVIRSGLEQSGIR
eukprot:g17387.t1